MDTPSNLRACVRAFDLQQCHRGKEIYEGNVTKSNKSVVRQSTECKISRSENLGGGRERNGL